MEGKSIGIFEKGLETRRVVLGTVVPYYTSVLAGPCSVAQTNPKIGKLDSLITRLIDKLHNTRPTTHAQGNSYTMLV